MNTASTKALCILSLTVLWFGESHRVAAQSAGVLREVYSGISGTSFASLTNSSIFPNTPSAQDVLSVFEGPINVGDNYGQRLSAYAVAPATGSYVFWIASDDNSTLFLSTDDTPARKGVIASVPGATGSREWGKYAQQQ